MMKQYFFKSHMIKMVTFVQCNIFEWIWYSESILIVYLFTSGKKMSQQQCMPVFIQMKLDPVWIQHLQIKLTKFVNFYWMLCLNKKNVTSYQLFHATLKGTIHILRQHLYSTKLNLTFQFFYKNWGFSSKQKNLFFNITFWQFFHALVWHC